MRNTTRVVLALLACAPAIHAAPGAVDCKYRDEPAPEAQSAKETTITLLATLPAEGGDVRAATVVEVDVEYHLAKFRPDAFFLMAMFPTSEGATSPDDTSNTPALTAAAGRAHLCVPLTNIYANDQMRWPLSMDVMLLEMRDSYSGSSAARSRKVKFNALDLPEDALKPHVEGPQDLIADALKASAGFFDARAARYKACIAKIPAMQPALTKAYRGWEARHRADIEMVAELAYQRDLDRAKGRADYAARFGDSSAEYARLAYEGLSPITLRRVCDQALEEFVDADDPTDNAIGDYLGVLRKSRASSKPAKVEKP